MTHRGLRNNNKSLQEWLGLEDTEVAGGPTRATPAVADVATGDRRAGMNLAEALAAERGLTGEVGRGPMSRPNRSSDPGPIEGSPAPSMKVSLMRLIKETDGCDGVGRGNKMGEEAEGGCDPVCCVCMGRRKDAAFIPCGHTFCRACARQVWASRGSCALCNRSIIEVLDIIY